MIRNLTIVLSAVVVLSLLAVMQGCNRASGQAGMAMPPPVVTTAPVVTADVPSYLDEIGKTTAYAAVNVIPQVSGQIVEQLFTDGDNIKAGQQLFTIQRTPYQAILDQSKAALKQSQAQLANAKTNFDRVASELPSKAVSQQDYDNAKNSMDVADATVEAAKAQVVSAQWNLDNCSIDSPIDGLAGQRLVDKGNVVNANSTVLLSIQKLVPIYVDFTIPENELDRVRENLRQHSPLKVEVTTPNAPGKTADGEVTFLDNMVQDGTGTIKVRATVKNEDRRFWPGQFVNVRLIVATLKDAKLVPSESVQISQQGPYVFVVKDQDVAQQVFVTVGQRLGDSVVIEKGLNGDEAVIQTGQLMVQDGKPVMIPKPAAQPATQPASDQASAASGSSAGTGS